MDGSSGWASGFLPLAVKKVRNDTDGKQESSNLLAVYHALKLRPRPYHVTQFEGAYPFYDQHTQTSDLYIAARCSSLP